MTNEIQTKKSTSCSTASRIGGSLPRRSFILGIGAIAVSGCVSTEPLPVLATLPEAMPAPTPVVPPLYYAMPNERFPVPEVDITQLNPQFGLTVADIPKTGQQP